MDPSDRTEGGGRTYRLMQAGSTPRPGPTSLAFWQSSSGFALPPRGMLPIERSSNRATLCVDKSPPHPPYRPEPQWNVLADGLAQSGGFCRASKKSLEWTPRFALMLREVDEAKPDILTLQECNHFTDGWLPALRARGYDGLHVAKPASAAAAFGAPSDGLGLFWRTDRVRLASRHTFQYSKYLDSPSNQSALVAQLELLDVDGTGGAERSGAVQPLSPGLFEQGLSPGTLDRSFGRGIPLVLATTHLKAKESAENDAIRSGQALELLEAVNDETHAVAEATGLRHDHVPVVITGDFNTEPDSAAVSRFNRSRLRLSSYWGLWGGKEGGNGVTGGGGSGRDISPPPTFSTWKLRDKETEKKRVIDYVWWRAEGKGALVPQRAWRPPTEGDIGPDALPCASYPSDHVSLLLEFSVGEVGGGGGG